MSSQFETKLEDIPLHSLYNLLRPITLPRKLTRFNNWGRAFYCTPLAIFEPESLFQCKLVLELARREGKTVRAAGVGHSPSDLACTSGYMVRLTKMNRLIQVSSSSNVGIYNAPEPSWSLQLDCITIPFYAFSDQSSIVLRALSSSHHFWSGIRLTMKNGTPWWKPASRYTTCMPNLTNITWQWLTLGQYLIKP